MTGSGPITEFRPVQDGTPAAGSLLAQLECVYGLLCEGAHEGAITAVGALIDNIEQHSVEVALVEPISLLQRAVDSLERIEARLGTVGGGDSSLQVEDRQKGDPAIVSKFYPHAPLTTADVDHALDIHAYAHREAAARAMEGWAETLAQVQEAKNGA